jgi:hypothetical protein
MFETGFQPDHLLSAKGNRKMFGMKKNLGMMPTTVEVDSIRKKLLVADCPYSKIFLF